VEGSGTVTLARPGPRPDMDPEVARPEGGECRLARHVVTHEQHPVGT
jgi:hypothetical protein